MTAWRLLMVAIATFVVWLIPATAHLWTKLFHAQSIEKLGQWGDSFGAFSALASAGAFIGAIYAIIQQQRQIDQARRDQEDVNKEARKEEHRQRFDANFFELLRLLRENRDAVRFKYSQDYINKRHPYQIGATQKVEKARLSAQKTKKGLSAFIAAWREYRFHEFSYKTSLTKVQVAAIYDKEIHNRYESTFGPYFRLMYTILNRLRQDSVLSLEEKLEYGRILRGQLTSYETALAGLNGLSEVSGTFDQLIIMFRILRYLPEGGRLRTMVKYYPPETFAARD